MIYEKFSMEQHGFAGQLAKPDNDTDIAVIVISGGEKSIISAIKLAEKLAINGIAALAVSLFGAEGQSESPDHIPLEMFISAANYLKSTKKYRKISIYGVSMASIFAVLTARYVEDIDSVIMVSPTHVPFEGTTRNKKTMTGRSIVTLNGKNIPYVHTDFSAAKPTQYGFDKRAERKVLGMWSAFESAYEDKRAENEAYLCVEKLHSRVLMIAGECDEAWNSAYSVSYIQERLNSAHYPYEHKALIYPHASHLIGIMPDRKRNKLLYCAIPLLGLLYRSFSLYRGECMSALESSEKEIIAWIKNE